MIWVVLSASSKKCSSCLRALTPHHDRLLRRNEQTVRPNGLSAERSRPEVNSLSVVRHTDKFAPYQKLSLSMMFIKGCPVNEAVVWSPVIFPNSCGFL